MADLHLTDARPTDEERAAVDRVVAPADGAVQVSTERLVRGGEARRRERRHLLLPALHALQADAGWISPGGLNCVAERLGVPPAEAYGVATFYEMFRTTDPGSGGSVTHVCVDPPCRMAGADPATAHPSPCLGQCDRAPATFVQGRGEPDRAPADALETEPPVRTPDGERRITRRIGLVDPTSLDSYRATGGYEALDVARAKGADAVIDAIAAAGLTGRGGAGFPTAVKWRAVADESSGPKHVVANCDESEPGTFKDRVLMEHDPFALVEAMSVAALTVGAERGWIYVRGEYPRATARLRDALAQTRAAGLLPDGFDIELRRGAGAYICGEETALFNSIEGRRGEPRNKPPFPTTHGLFGEPTAINNPETLFNVLDILAVGGDASTRLFSLSGRVARPGLYEVDLATTLGELLAMAGGATGELRAVLLGGAAGSFVGPDQLDDALSSFPTLGSGAVVVFDHDVDMADAVGRIAEFFRDESCGQCVPCRVGTVRQHELVTAPGPVRVELVDDIGRAMRDASICGLGHTAASAVQSALALGLVR